MCAVVPVPVPAAESEKRISSVRFAAWATLAIGLNLPGLVAHPVAPLKVCRWPPNAAPHSLGSPRARLTPVTLCTSALSPPHRRSPVQPAPVSPKIAYSAAGRALAHGTMCPTHPTGRHIVPTYLLEPTRGGGATVHATFIRTGRVLILADMVVAPNESIVSHRSMHGQAIKTVSINKYVAHSPASQAAR